MRKTIALALAVGLVLSLAGAAQAVIYGGDPSQVGSYVNVTYLSTPATGVFATADPGYYAGNPDAASLTGGYDQIPYSDLFQTFVVPAGPPDTKFQLTAIYWNIGNFNEYQNGWREDILNFNVSTYSGSPTFPSKSGVGTVLASENLLTGSPAGAYYGGVPWNPVMAEWALDTAILLDPGTTYVFQSQLVWREDWYWQQTAAYSATMAYLGSSYTTNTLGGGLLQDGYMAWYGGKQIVMALAFDGEYVTSDIPEPATISLLAIGSLAAMMRRRRA
ncbi:MAG: PEP-CTERM sorting domain-containing protein [Planctomycetaceae bacterium]|nr:PEP-CTERM sorting domain-containing protein [Planctomycetaceae bacterium]